MKTLARFISLLLAYSLLLFAPLFAWSSTELNMLEPNTIPLPTIKNDNGISVERALNARRSVRNFQDMPLTLEDTGRLCWAGQGITTEGGYRTAPSAGALYPLELYLVTRDVRGLKPGAYHYDPMHHSLEPIRAGQLSSLLASASLNQPWVKQAPAVIVIAGVCQRTTRKYGERGIRYVHVEAGAAAENICLEAVSSGLGTVIVGAFDDKQVKTVVGLRAEEEPVLIVAIGR